MRKFIALFIILAFVSGILHSGSATANASFTLSSQAEITLLENGDYLETVIIDSPTIPHGISIVSIMETVTKTKIAYYKNQSGDTLWSVSIQATFSYDGSTSKCIFYSHSTTCPAKAWKIKSVSSSKSENSATATATATHSGLISKDYTQSVTISCSKNGIVS